MSQAAVTKQSEQAETTANLLPLGGDLAVVPAIGMEEMLAGTDYTVIDGVLSAAIRVAGGCINERSMWKTPKQSIAWR